jgi:hypothetical protein
LGGNHKERVEMLPTAPPFIIDDLGVRKLP